MQPLTESQLEKLGSLPTPVVANVIESFSVRLRNEGYMNPSIHNRLTRPVSMVGYAVTARMRTDAPPARGRYYPDRSDWWNLLQSMPEPRIIVIEDTDEVPGVGSVCGGTHGVILKTLGCIGIITNGAVRDLPELEKQQMHVYSGGIIPSHAYAHIVEVGMPVEIGGLKIACGDLLHGDRHGIISIPPSIAADIHARAQIQLNHEREIIDYCRSPGFLLEKLRQMVAVLPFTEGEK